MSAAPVLDRAVPAPQGAHAYIDPGDRAGWLDLRRGYCTASKVGAVLRLAGAHGSPWDVWAEAMGIATPEPPSEAMQDGLDLEPFILAKYGRTHDLSARELWRNSGSRLIVGPQPWMACTPDALRRPVFRGGRLLRCDVNVQAKATWEPRRFDFEADHPDDMMPPSIAAQVQWEMACTGAPVTHVPVLLFRRLRIIEVPRDDAVIAALIKMAGAWWTRHVLAGEPPAVDGSPACAEYLLRQPRTGERAATDEEVTWARERVGVQAQIRALETQKAEIDGRLLASMTDSERLTLPGGRVSIVERAGAVKWKSVAEAMHAPAEIVAQHTGAPSRYLDVRVK